MSAPMSVWLGVALVAALVLGAGGGSVLRGLVLARVQRSGRVLVRRLGTAWVNVPASALAAALLVLQTRLALLPGEAPGSQVVLVALLLGACGGLSTWSALALDIARALLGGRRAELLTQLVGVLLGVCAALAGAGVATVATLLLG